MSGRTRKTLCVEGERLCQRSQLQSSGRFAGLCVAGSVAKDDIGFTAWPWWKALPKKWWCWNPECEKPVSVSKDKIESEWIQYLTDLQPAFDALVNVIPVLARTHQQRPADAMSGKRRELSTRLSEKKALQVELVTAKVKGEIAQDDFDVLKASLGTVTSLK